MVASNRGKAAMDAIRAHIAAETGRQSALVGRLRARSVLVEIARTFAFIIVAGINLAFLGYAYLQIRAAMSGCDRQQRRAEAGRELLSVTLASIGDAVIVTDAWGRVTFVNSVAEELTGWGLAEAAGRPCSEVFNVISETSRTAIENPVSRVLREGVVVGFANHTLLIRRDGREVHPAGARECPHPGDRAHGVRDGDLARCREAGFDAHLTKPVNLQRLEALIRQFSGA
ncbi:MAG TPA: PAS domain-containing protein [Opitutaceae bacterium]|jgi:PAS domain S-box-containing protein